MNNKIKLTLFCFVLLLVSIVAVSAADTNLTDDNAQLNNQFDDSAVAVENENNQQNNIEDLAASDMESDNELKSTSSDKKVTVSNVKTNSKINAVSHTVVKGTNFKIRLRDVNNNPISGATVTFTHDGSNQNVVTDSKGLAGIKISNNPGTYFVKVSYKGNKDYNGMTNTFKVIVPKQVSIVIGNDKLLTGGFLRIYLKSGYSTAISHKTLTIKVGNKKFTKTTNSEGFISFKPYAGKGNLPVTVTFGGTSDVYKASASKNVVGIKGVAKNPYKAKIPLKNKMPDLDYMYGRFIMADGNMKYTVLKDHYLEVIKTDSYCLFLNNKLSKYVVFKTKAQPGFFHVIKRGKWNVIEREINKRIVLKNKYGYWPCQVTVSLKNKWYTYSEVRDVQDTGYTCGPTSSSMCSQVLRNYVNEAYLAVKAGATPSSGSSTSGLKYALEQCNMKCQYYYKSSFNTALNELKKGGCALIFHTWGHYVAILDISSDGKKVLVGNPSGDYDHGSHSIPTNWLTVNYMYNQFNNYDTSGLIVKLKYSLSNSAKKKFNNLYSNMGGGWNRANTNERIPQI